MVSPTPNDGDIRKVIERYVELVGCGTADELAALYAENATLEDPVGSEPRSGREQIRAFYASIEDLQRETRLVQARVCGGQAAFHFELRTTIGDTVYAVAPIDVMTFDEDANITSMRAFWGAADMTVS